MIVTRFAPSPTGYLHIGGARTAMFNWLLAKKTGGKFLLRIEDTDIKRNTPTATAQVINDLKWLGLTWDEGPEVGGPNGPYHQSERCDIYNKYIKQLLEEGKAYYCFDTSEDMQEMRNATEQQQKGFIYPRPAVFPSEADAEQARKDDKPVTVRFVMPEREDIIIDDIIRGKVKFNSAELGDFIILKSDGFPTYHMAVVIDDELMGVTHVLRGQEHLMNTPFHQMLQKALGFRVPVYAHMSVTVSDGGGKLSKREQPKALRLAIRSRGKDLDLDSLANAGGITVDEIKSFMAEDSTPDMPAIDAMAQYLGVKLPEINVVDFFRSGYLPETMVNFLALLGWNPGNDKEIMTVEELIESFDVSRLNKANSLFDRKKLLAFNTEHIRSISRNKLLSHFEHYLKMVDSPLLEADDEMLLKLIDANQGARTLEDIERKCRFLFAEDDAVEYDAKDVEKVLLKNDGEGLKMLCELRPMLAAIKEVSEESIENLLRSLGEQKGVGLGKIAQPLRVAISGCTISPPIFVSIEMLTMERTLNRIDNTLKRLNIKN